MNVSASITELPVLRFRLPGQWFMIPLRDRDEARASIERLVAQQVGKADRFATLRRDIRVRMFSALQEAIDGEGQSMQVALNIVPEVPISASFTVFLPAVSLTPSFGTSPTAVMDVFQQGLAAATELETATRFTMADSEVLRVHRRHTASFDEKHEDIDTLMVDYWMTIPETKRVVLVSFSTLYSEISEIMLTFFDSIVRASYWQYPEPSGEGSAMR